MTIPRGICVCSGTIDPHGGSVALAVQRHNQTPEHVAWRGLQVPHPCDHGCGTIIAAPRPTCRFCARWRSGKLDAVAPRGATATREAGPVPTHRPPPAA